MKNTETKDYSENALNSIKNILESRNSEMLTSKPVKQTITYDSYNEQGNSLKSILNAIDIIAQFGNENDFGTIAELTDLAKKLIPNDILELLDGLLLENKN